MSKVYFNLLAFSLYHCFHTYPPPPSEKGGVGGGGGGVGLRAPFFDLSKSFKKTGGNLE